jgi:alkylation response protein AidB-like acyl-CoA dehydrogenase
VTGTDEHSQSVEALRAEIREWLDQHWDTDLSVDEWWRLVANAGWTTPHFAPEEGGRGLHRTAGNTVRAAFEGMAHFARRAASGC